MIDLKSHLDRMDDVRHQISLTNSKQRKYELHKHLRKLEKQYRVALNYMSASKGQVMDGKT